MQLALEGREDIQNIKVNIISSRIHFVSCNYCAKYKNFYFSHKNNEIRDSNKFFKDKNGSFFSQSYGFFFTPGS
jgi:hypothetical protein